MDIFKWVGGGGGGEAIHRTLSCCKLTKSITIELVTGGALCSDVCGIERVTSGIHLLSFRAAYSGQPFFVCRAHVGAELRYGFQLPGPTHSCSYSHKTSEPNMDCLCRNGKVELELN